MVTVKLEDGYVKYLGDTLVIYQTDERGKCNSIVLTPEDLKNITQGLVDRYSYPPDVVKVAA